MEDRQDRHNYCKNFCKDQKKILMKLGIKINIGDIYIEHSKNDSHYSVHFPEPYGYIGTFQECCKRNAIARAFIEVIAKKEGEI